MLTYSDELAAVLASPAYTYQVRVESWLGDTLLADDVPVSDGNEETDSTLRVPERITLTIPAEMDGVSWVPTAFDSPLGWFGQQLRILIGVDTEPGTTEWLQRGWFLIESTEVEDDTITVEAVGLLQLVDEAVLAATYQPATGDECGDILRDLLLPGIPVNTDAGPTDRAVSVSSVSFSDNRLDDVLAVLDAWPADGYVDETGVFTVTAIPDDSGDADLSLSDEWTSNGQTTVISQQASGTRDGLYNAVVASGQYPDSDTVHNGQQIIATATDTDPASPFVVGGNFSPYLVPYGYSSPLLTTLAQVQAAANTVLARLLRNGTQQIQITCPPDPRVQVGDLVDVESQRLGFTGKGRVQALTLPYVASGDAMTLTVVLSSREVL